MNHLHSYVHGTHERQDLFGDRYECSICGFSVNTRLARIGISEGATGPVLHPDPEPRKYVSTDDAGWTRYYDRAGRLRLTVNAAGEPVYPPDTDAGRAQRAEDVSRALTERLAGHPGIGESSRTAALTVVEYTKARNAMRGLPSAQDDWAAVCRENDDE